MNITSTPATITHIALMLASGVSRIGVSAPKATPGRTSEAIAATGPAIKSLFFIPIPPSPPEARPGGRGLGEALGERHGMNGARELCLDGWRKSGGRVSHEWQLGSPPCPRACAQRLRSPPTRSSSATPGRALLLAQELLEEPKMSNHARGLWGYSGRTPAGDELTIQATGMGGPERRAGARRPGEARRAAGGAGRDLRRRSPGSRGSASCCSSTRGDRRGRQRRLASASPPATAVLPDPELLERLARGARGGGAERRPSPASTRRPARASSPRRGPSPPTCRPSPSSPAPASSGSRPRPS